MKRISLLIGLGLLVSVACPLEREVRKDCQQTPAMQKKVSDALDLEAFEQELTGLVASASLCAVDVIVQDLVGRAGFPDAGEAKAAIAPSVELRALRGQSWLADHPAPK
jgi:hypothetical protein